MHIAFNFCKHEMAAHFAEHSEEELSCLFEKKPRKTKNETL